MSNNYFAVERKGKTVDHVCIRDDNGAVAFEEVLDMSYEDLKAYDQLDSFVCAVMDATNGSFKADDEQTFITLIDEDDVFVWGILMGPANKNGEISYKLVDWQKDGIRFKY